MCTDHILWLNFFDFSRILKMLKKKENNKKKKFIKLQIFSFPSYQANMWTPKQGALN